MIKLVCDKCGKETIDKGYYSKNFLEYMFYFKPEGETEFREFSDRLLFCRECCPDVLDNIKKLINKS